MDRIICDVYKKENKSIWGDDRNDEFNRKILAVNDMYGWLYARGVLKEASFVYKDYDDKVYFALDAKELEPYRHEMEQNGAENAALAVRHIFDEDYTPCHYSGAIELGWTMFSYRDVDGCVGKSWECGLIKGLDTKTIYDVDKVKESRGVKEAVKAAFDAYEWEPTLDELGSGVKTQAVPKKDICSQQASSLDNMIQSASARAEAENRTSESQAKEFTFAPHDYEAAKAALLASGETTIDWKNEGYACRLERSDSDDIYYDLHLTTTGTTIMYGESVEVLGADHDLVNIRVPGDESEHTSISKAFFERNFAPSAVLDTKKERPVKVIEAER